MHTSIIYLKFNFFYILSTISFRWVINVQLSTLSCVFGTVACLTQNTVEIDKHGFFAGYTTYTVMVITLQASVGLVRKYYFLE